MDLYDFIRLDQKQREAIVWEQGTFLTERASGGGSMVLYAMGKFFAEVIYLPATNQIMLVRGFGSRFCLEPYLKMVDLSDIR